MDISHPNPDPPSSEASANSDFAATVRGLQIISAAFAFGVVSFAGIVGLLSVITEQDPAEDAGIIGLLSLVHLAMALSLWPLAFFLHARMLSAGASSATPNGPGPDDAPTRHARSGNARGARLGAIRGATLIRLAMLEGAALFGLVICLLGTLEGVLRTEPKYWLNALSAVLFLAFVVATFPTRERVESQLEELDQGSHSARIS